MAEDVLQIVPETSKNDNTMFYAPVCGRMPQGCVGGSTDFAFLGWGSRHFVRGQIKPGFDPFLPFEHLSIYLVESSKCWGRGANGKAAGL